MQFLHALPGVWHCVTGTCILPENVIPEALNVILSWQTMR